jgi:hypothetical protein
VGHKSATTTLRYVNVEQEDVLKDVAKLATRGKR